jgi:hypothetical protein
MIKKITLYMGLLISLFAFNSEATAKKAIDSVYYYMKIDTMGVDAGFLRIDSVNSDRLTVDNAKGDYALWRFVEFRDSYNIVDPNHYWIINYKTQDTLKFKAPVSCLDTVALINEDGNLFRWEQLFLDHIYNVDTLIASYRNMDNIFGVSYSFFLTLNSTGEVMLMYKDSNLYPRLRFQIERGTSPPDESKFYRLKVDTLGVAAIAPLGYLATDSVNTDSLTVDSVKSFYSAWRFETDTVIDDTTCYRIYNKATDTRLSFDVPADDTVAVISGSGDLNSWRIPFFVEVVEKVAKLTVLDTATRQKYYLGLKDSAVMLVSNTSEVKFLTFALEDEFPPVYIPPLVDPFDSTEIYKVKMLSGANKGKYWARSVTLQNTYIDSVYAHVPDGQFVVNKLNYNSLINRNISSAVTDTFRFAVKPAGDTIPDVFVYGSDTVEAKPIRYGSLDKSDSLLGYKYFQLADLQKDSCFYLQYVSPDSLNGRILGAGNKNREVSLLATGDTARYFIEYEGTNVATEAPANIAALRRNIYSLRSQQDTMLYLSGNTPSEMALYFTNRGKFIFKESELQGGGYSIIVTNNNLINLFVDSVSKRLGPSSNRSSLFRFVKTEIPVYPDDEFQYLRYLPKGKGLYEVHSTIAGLGEKMLTKNFYNYAVFSKEGESVLRAGSYLPADFYLWLDTARGAGSNRFRTSIFIIKEVSDTTGFDVQGFFLHVNDSTDMLLSDDENVLISAKRYSRGNYVRARRTGSSTLQLLDKSSSVGDGTPNVNSINEYRFYLQKTEEEDTTYYLVTEKGYGGHRDSTGYLSFANDKYYFGPREGTNKLIVRLKNISGSTVANEVVSPPSVLEDIARKEIEVIGGTGLVTVRNALGKRVQVYNILGQTIADIIAASDNETITIPRGIAIVKAGPSVTKKVVVK